MKQPAALSVPAMAALLAALAALAPFSIDTYLPSFPEIGERLSATPLQVQQTLTAYMLPYALMSLWHGVIADALGRRSVILWTLALFGLTSLGCALATSIEQLWLLRAAQGVVAGAGAVVGRAIIRDLYDGADAQRLMSQVTMTFAIAPAIAPIIGGWLHTWYGWRAVFAFLTLFAAGLWLVSWRRLPETLPHDQRQSLHPGYLLRAYWQVFTSLAFLSGSLATSFNFIGFFLYIMSAPVFLMRHLGLSEREFIWLFGPAMAGLVLGAWLSNRLAGRTTRQAAIARGYALMAGAALSNLLLNAFLAPAIPASVVPIFIYTLGMSLVMPSLTLETLDLFPAQRGLASSCQATLQSLCSALAAGVLAPMLWHSTLSLAGGMAALLATGATCAALHHRLSHRKHASS